MQFLGPRIIAPIHTPTGELVVSFCWHDFEFDESQESEVAQSLPRAESSGSLPDDKGFNVFCCLL